MRTNSEAIRLAEASDWKGLQRLIEMAPRFAREMGDYGMLPIHWACTESHVPLALLDRLLAAFPDGAKVKNDAELLPLHIAIRARVEPEWLEKLIEIYPNAVHVDAPDHVSVMELAHRVGLHKDGLKILHLAITDSLPLGSSRGLDSDDQLDEHPEDDEGWLPLKRKSLLDEVSPLGSKLPPNFGRGSNSINNTPVSPAESMRSISSEEGEHLSHHDDVHRGPSTGRLVSPTSSSSSSASANTAPIPRSSPTLQANMNSSSFRKHSLDYHVHAATVAAAARQHQEIMQRGGLHPGNSSQRSMPLTGRHQSLPAVPSFEHVRFDQSHQHDHFEDQSSDEDEGILFNSNRSSSRLSGGNQRRGANSDGARSFESPPEWKRDDECSICRASFGMFKHRHHCRNCGKSICRQHSADKKIMMESKGFTTPQRVCVTCYAMITHKQSQEANLQPSSLDGVLQGAKITGPVAAFHQQMQQQQHQHPQLQSVRSTTASSFTGMTSPGSAGPASARSSINMPQSNSVVSANGAKDKVPEQWVMQAQVNELRQIVAAQQKHIEQLTHSNMQMQQQILEQEELKAETMLLITQLMTRVSVLELNRNVSEQEKDEEELLLSRRDD